MRTAALIFGLLASVLGGAAIVFGNLGTGLAAALALGSASSLAAEIGLYLIAFVGLLGACMVLPRPRLGGVLMLLAAAAWAVASLMAGHGAVLFAALPFTFVGAGGLVALSASRDVAPREEAPAPRRLARDVESRWPEPQDDVPEDVEDEDSGNAAPAYPPSQQRPGTRNEPDFGIEPRRRKDLAPRSPAPRYREPPPEVEPEPPVYAEEPPEEEDYPPEEDYVDADTSSDDEAASPVEYEYPDEPEQPEDDPPLESDEPEVDRPRQERPPQGRSAQDRWSLPDPGSQPPRRQMPPRARYIAERQQPAPARREALPARDAPRPGRRVEYEDDRDPPEDDFGPARRSLPPPRSRDSYRDVEPYYASEQQPERSPLNGLLRILVLLLFIIVVVGIAVAVYLDYARGPESILFGNREQPTANVTSPPSAAEPAAPDTASIPSEDATPADQPDTADDSAPAPSPAASSAPATAAAAPVPLARPVASTPAAGISDPFAYCHAVDTVDSPDSRYAGPAVPPVIASALGMTQSVPADQVHWRCSGQMVLACNAKQSAACDLTPTVDLMVSYCAQHPNTQNIPAPNGSWSCTGTRPVIPRDQKWPVDARGFFPDAWSRVAPPTG